MTFVVIMLQIEGKNTQGLARVYSVLCIRSVKHHCRVGVNIGVGVFCVCVVNAVKSNIAYLLLHRFYHLIKRGRVVNCPYVDNSYKWAGGGFLSTVGDLLLFGNALLYSYQVAHLEDTEGLLPGFLKPKSVVELWSPVDKTEASWDKDGLYGQGWLVVEKLQKYGQCRKRRHYVSHTGGAVGASSVLLVLPSEEIDHHQGQTVFLPQGVVVTIITNMQSVGLNTTALKIAHQFDKARNV